jgi:acyl carrier protein
MLNVADKSDIINEIKKTISEISRINLFDLDDNIKIREELGIDSLMAIEIIAKCERRFNIKIDETKLDSVQTMGDFINFVVSITEKK